VEPTQVSKRQFLASNSSNGGLGSKLWYFIIVLFFKRNSSLGRLKKNFRTESSSRIFKILTGFAFFFLFNWQYYVYMGGEGVELRASHLLGKCSIT
jgi:hypothetical protein